MVSIVGIVRQVEVTSTKISYIIDDFTDKIDVIKYADGENVSWYDLSVYILIKVWSSCLIDCLRPCV